MLTESHSFQQEGDAYSIAESKEHFIKRADLPISCPTKEMTLWNEHPRVFLPLGDKEHETVCPYCGAKFILTD